MSQALSAGQLDAVLFPDNPVANAPQIITTLRTLFPVKAGGFIIGPMLELGWGTPSLVTVRLGLLVEAGQFTLLGQAIIQIPPLVSCRPRACSTCGSTSSARWCSIRCASRSMPS